MTDLQTLIAKAYAEVEPQPAPPTIRDTFEALAELICVGVIVAGLIVVAIVFAPPLPTPV